MLELAPLISTSNRSIRDFKSLSSSLAIKQLPFDQNRSEISEDVSLYLSLSSNNAQILRVE